MANKHPNCHRRSARDGERSKRSRKQAKKKKHKSAHERTHKKRPRQPSTSSNDPSGESTSGEQRPRAGSSKKQKRKEKSSSSSSSSDSSNSQSTISISSGDDDEQFSRKEKRRAKRKFRTINRSWAKELRPDYLQTWQDCADVSLFEMQGLRAQLEKDAEKQNLGEEVFTRDCKPKKIKHKAQTDNGTTKLHLARFHRQPLSHPKKWYDKVPQKRTEIIRNFPQDHYGLQGQVSPTTIGKLHNRTVLQTFEAFGKTSTKPGKTGKYADEQQLEEALLNYGSLMHAVWPYDYSLFPIWRVLVESRWGKTVTSDEKKRSELVVEFFNSILADNAAKAVNEQYPCVFEQVTLLIDFLNPDPDSVWTTVPIG